MGGLAVLALSINSLFLQHSTPSATSKAAESEASVRSNYIARYLNLKDFSRPTSKSAIVFIVADDMKIDRIATSALTALLRTNAFHVIHDFFRSEFVSDGLFTQTLEGSTEAIQKLQLENRVNVLLLGREEVQYSTDAPLGNVVSAHMRLEVVVVFVSPHAESKAWTFTANGSGFKEGQAREMAEERILKQLTNNTNLAAELQNSTQL